MKFGWRPFQYNDYYSDLPDGVKRELPNKYSQSPFAHLAKPQILYMDFPSCEKGEQQQQESYYDEITADGVPGTSLSFLTSLEDIHIVLPVTFDLSTGEVIQFLKGRKHFIHLPKEWFTTPSTFTLHNEVKYEDEDGDEDEDDIEIAYDDRNEHSTLIRYLTYFLEEIMHVDILMNYPCNDKMDEDHYRLNCKTRWIVRYPPVGQGIMEQVKDNLLEIVDRGEIERLARDGIVMVDNDERREDVKEKKMEGIGGKLTTEKVGDGNGESKVELWFMRYDNSQCLTCSDSK
ncbi:hypothetical protein V865_008135 [Kwoniella europaea PYCC6329]|uniref:Uncharacterized protein n=1 Tax=Kwoniella europaea PYCC6329 TaxID=1423913 RepID=A0AAX4KUT7_9TREE